LREGIERPDGVAFYNDEMERIWKEAVLELLKCYRCVSTERCTVPAELEENHDIFRQGIRHFLPGVEPSVSRTRFLRLAARSVCVASVSVHMESVPCGVIRGAECLKMRRGSSVAPDLAGA
jgi:hypothetical protein